jgi:hypothetical protein
VIRQCATYFFSVDFGQEVSFSFASIMSIKAAGKEYKVPSHHYVNFLALTLLLGIHRAAFFAAFQRCRAPYQGTQDTGRRGGS